MSTQTERDAQLDQLRTALPDEIDGVRTMSMPPSELQRVARSYIDQAHDQLNQARLMLQLVDLYEEMLLHPVYAQR